MLQMTTRALAIGAASTLCTFTFYAARAHAQDSGQTSQTVKVAAVQISGYDKTDVPKEGYDPTEAMIPYIEQSWQRRCTAGRVSRIRAGPHSGAGR